jgi:hypothetical protein
MGSFFSLGFTAIRLDASKTDDTKMFGVSVHDNHLVLHLEKK